MRWCGSRAGTDLLVPVERSYALREGIEVMHPLQAVAYLAQLSD